MMGPALVLRRLSGRGFPDGSVVVVTGASSGIGAATARALGPGAHRVVLVARGRESLAEVAQQCRRAGAASVEVQPVDVGDDDAVADLFAGVIERHGRVDAVLHCAGQVTYGRTDQTTAVVFDQVLSTNLSGSANVARHAIIRMREQGHGTLVLVGSLLGHVAVPDMTPYVVSKWGVRALARQLSLESRDVPGLHVCHVAPGSVDTPIYGNALESAGTVNAPPPPTISPERVARVVLARLDDSRSSSQTAWSNYVLIAGFSLVPRVYDALIGPVFRLASRGDGSS